MINNFIRLYMCKFKLQRMHSINVQIENISRINVFEDVHRLFLGVDYNNKLIYDTKQQRGERKYLCGPLYPHFRQETNFC